MRSIDDGVTWNAVAAPEANYWLSIATDGAGIWCAVALSGTNRIMRSIDDGVTWTSEYLSEANSWFSVAMAGDIVIGVSYDGTNRIFRMTGALTSAITNINIAPIPAEREAEFKSLILQYKPMATWAALIVVWT